MTNVKSKHYALLLLTVVGVFNYLDRGVMNLAMESIKSEFQLSDSQLGLMSGFAFALFYAVAGIPIARWADRGNRNYVVTVVTALWSVMLILCSMVGSFTQLLLARVGVAVGESGCLPSAHSLISDYFDRVERPRAMAIFWLCGPIATIIASVGGGWLIEQVGWRNTFMIIGLPGIVLAIVVKLTLREPRVEQPIPVKSVATEQPSIKDVMAVILSNHSLRHNMISYSLLSFFVLGISVWLPPFYIRSHGMDTAELGLWFGLSAAGALCSTYLGGYLATRYASRREDWQMKGIAVSVIISGLFHILCCLAENKTTSLIFMSINMGVFIYLGTAPLFAAIQSLLDVRMRAVAMALILMFANLIGMGLGPLFVGIISDLLTPSFGHESLRNTLLLISPGYLWAAFHTWKVAGTIRDDIRSVEKNAELNLAEKDTSEVEILPSRSPDSLRTQGGYE